MKRFIILLAIVLAFSPIFAQDNGDDPVVPTTTNAKEYTPTAGDIGLGMSLTPILSYFGNFFHGTNSTGVPYADFGYGMSTNSLMLKYFFSDNMAARVNLGFNNYTYTNNYYVQNDVAILADPLSNAKVVDIHKYMHREYDFGVGVEYRRGSNRLQGVFGADLNFFYNNSKHNYTYGNPMSADNPNPSTYNFGGNILGNERVLNSYGGESYGLSLVPFIGFEYFIAPKISIGANTGINFSFTKDGQSKYLYEIQEAQGYAQRTGTSLPGDISRNFGNANPYMNFYMMFHF